MLKFAGRRADHVYGESPAGRESGGDHDVEVLAAPGRDVDRERPCNAHIWIVTGTDKDHPAETIYRSDRDNVGRGVASLGNRLDGGRRGQREIRRGRVLRRIHPADAQILEVRDVEILAQVQRRPLDAVNHGAGRQSLIAAETQSAVAGHCRNIARTNGDSQRADGAGLGIHHPDA